MKRPDMRDYFRGRIDYHVHGMMARSAGRQPSGVDQIHGDVTDSTITVIMRDGTVWTWTGGAYANRKVAGCYAPLMPKPAETPRFVPKANAYPHNRLFGLWDTVEVTWYDGDHHDDALYGAGIPAWAQSRAHEVAAKLNAA